MDPKLHDLIHNNKLYRGLVPEILKLLPLDDAELDVLIGETVANHDPRTFNFIVISALVAKRPVDSRHLVGGTALLANVYILSCTVWKMQGEVAQHLVEGVRATVMNREMHATALLVAAAWSIEFREGKQPPDLIAEARLLARTDKFDPLRQGLLWALADMLNDSDLAAVLRARHPMHFKPDILRHAKEFGKARIAVCRSEVISHVPVKPDNLIGFGTNVRRAVARVGRNDPCPCGSGEKYKRCCEKKDQERMRNSSDVAGKTRAEVLAEPEPHLTEAKIMAMTPADLARLDAAKIHPKHLPLYFKMLGGALMVEEAATAFEKLGCETGEMEDAWDFIAFYVCMKRRLDVARRMVKVRFKDGPVPDTLSFDLRVLLASEDPARYLEVLETGAREALTSNDDEWLCGFADGLLMSPSPAVGIHCARSLIPLIGKRNATFLMSEIQLARDRLNLPPEEPFGEILEKRFAEEVADGGKDAEALRKARQRVETKAAEVNQLKESLEKFKREIRLQEKKAPAAAATQASAETPELRDLREKVRELKSSINERNSERAAYRREMGQTYAELEALRAKQSAASPARAVDAVDAEDALLLSGDIESNQPPRPIEFPRRFNDTLAQLPRQVGRAALILIGRIAAGDPTAFAGAIRLKAAPDVMRVRIGQDHRMLFRLLPESVQLVDLINRRDLERCIASL